MTTESTADASRSAPTISTPSGFSHNGHSKLQASPSLHFILFLTCMYTPRSFPSLPSGLLGLNYVSWANGEPKLLRHVAAQ